MALPPDNTCAYVCAPCSATRSHAVSCTVTQPSTARFNLGGDYGVNINGKWDGVLALPAGSIYPYYTIESVANCDVTALNVTTVEDVPPGGSDELLRYDALTKQYITNFKVCVFVRACVCPAARPQLLL